MADRTVITPTSSATTTTATGAASTGMAPSPYVDWAAIFAGAVVATAIGLVLAGFGAALGLGNLSAERGEGSGQRSLILTAIWALITVITSYFMGGYVAARMRRSAPGVSHDESAARDTLHGMVVWGLGVLIGAWVASNVVGSAANAVGNVAGSAAQAVGSVVQGAGSAVGGAASAAADAATGGEGAGGGDAGGLDLSGFNPIEAINNRLLRGTGEQVDPNATVSPVARDILFGVARTGELTDADREVLAQEVAGNSTLTPEEANARIDEAVAQVTQLRDEAQQRVDQAAEAAREAAETARRAAVWSAFIAAAGFAIALAAAVLGAGSGGRHRESGQLPRYLR